MSPSSDMDPASSAGPGSTRGDRFGTPPANWSEALMGLIASRLTLIQLESKDAARASAKRAGLLLAVVGCVFFAWILLLAAVVQLLATALDCPWSWVAVGVAILHLILAIILASLAKPSGDPSFPHTRSEFQKDREWIESLRKTRKSND